MVVTNPWVAQWDEQVGNGDVIVTTGQGQKIALIFATPSVPQRAMMRAEALIKFAAPRWCQHCGIDTVGTDECDGCASVLDAYKPEVATGA